MYHTTSNFVLYLKLQTELHNIKSNDVTQLQYLVQVCNLKCNKFTNNTEGSSDYNKLQIANYFLYKCVEMLMYFNGKHGHNINISELVRQIESSTDFELQLSDKINLRNFNYSYHRKLSFIYKISAIQYHLQVHEANIYHSCVTYSYQNITFIKINCNLPNFPS